MTNLNTIIKNMPKAEQDEALLNELNRLLDKGVINHDLYHKARRMWDI